MNKPTVEEIIGGLVEREGMSEETSSRYTAVMVTAKRARQINTYYRSLGEGGILDDFAPPLVTSGSHNYLTIAMEEVARGEIGYRIRGQH